MVLASHQKHLDMDLIRSSDRDLGSFVIKLSHSRKLGEPGQSI